VRDDCQGI